MQKTLLVLMLLFFTANLRAQSCKVMSSPKNDRLQSVHLPDGRQIYMLGNIHGDRALPFAMAELVKKRAPQMSDQTLHAELANFSERAVFALNEEKTDLVDLRALLAENPAIHFVGFETQDQFAQTNLENYGRMLADFHSLVQSRDPGSLSVANDLEQVVLGAAGFLKINEPELFASREIRGFESSHGTEQSDFATIASETALNQLKLLAAGDSHFIRDVNGTDIQLGEMYDEYTPAADTEILKQINKAPLPAAYKQATIEWVKLKLNEMAADKLREHDVVENILAAKASGILIMGSAHLGGVMTELQRKCLSMSTLTMN